MTKLLLLLLQYLAASDVFVLAAAGRGRGEQATRTAAEHRAAQRMTQKIRRRRKSCRFWYEMLDSCFAPMRPSSRVFALVELRRSRPKKWKTDHPRVASTSISAVAGEAAQSLFVIDDVASSKSRNLR